MLATTPASGVDLPCQRQDRTFDRFPKPDLPISRARWQLTASDDSVVRLLEPARQLARSGQQEYQVGASALDPLQKLARKIIVGE